MMNKSDAKLIVTEPEELIFRGNFRTPIKACLKLCNPHMDKYILFHMKTTAPKFYAACPTSGIIAPNQTMIIYIQLAPYEYTDNFLPKGHKFQIQAVECKESDAACDSNELWQRLNVPKDCWATKVKCVLRYDVTEQQNDVCQQLIAVDKKSTMPLMAAGDKKFGDELLGGNYENSTDVETHKTQTDLADLNQILLGVKQSLDNITQQAEMEAQPIKRIFVVFATIITMISMLVGYCIGRYY